MEPGVLAAIGICALAAFLIWLSFARTRAIDRRLVAAGFAPCDEEAHALLRALEAVAGGHLPTARRSYQIGRCFKRAAGWGMLHRFGAVDRTHADQDRDHAPMGGRIDVYLLDLPEPARHAHGALSVFLAPRAPRPLQALLAGLVKSDPHGAPLELPAGPHAKAFLAAFAAAPGKLDALLPRATQERLARAAELGFFAAHFGAGKLALVVLPDRPNLGPQLAYVAEWA
jgi:hypothetical protein